MLFQSERPIFLTCFCFSAAHRAIQIPYRLQFHVCYHAVLYPSVNIPDFITSSHVGPLMFWYISRKALTPQTTCWWMLWGNKICVLFFPFWSLHPELVLCLLRGQHFPSVRFQLFASLPLISCSPVEAKCFSHSRRLYNVSEQHSSITLFLRKVSIYSTLTCGRWHQPAFRTSSPWCN